MTRIENESQYEWAVARVEELLPLVSDDTAELIDVIKLRMFEMGLI